MSVLESWKITFTVYIWSTCTLAGLYYRILWKDITDLHKNRIPGLLAYCGNINDETVCSDLILSFDI